MVQKWNTTTYPKPSAATKIPAHVDDNTDGIDTALTHWDGASDPQDSWGSDEQGYLGNSRGAWTGVTGSSLNPKWARWEDLTGGGSYGWRALKLRMLKFLTTPVTVSLSPAGPYSADDALDGTNLQDVTTILDGAGVQDNDDKLVTEILLRIRVQTGASETLGADNAYFVVRQPSSTAEHRVYAQVVNRYAERDVWVPLDSSEQFEWGVYVGGGTASFTVALQLLAFMEEI